MSSSIHHTGVSTLGSFKFDKSRRKTITGQPKQSFNSKTKTSILMETNTMLNVVQETANDHHLRRYSFSMSRERLFQILSAPPDEPLYNSPTAANTTKLNGDNNTSGSNLLVQYEATTSSIVAVDDYENLPPADKCALANIEGYNIIKFVYLYVYDKDVVYLASYAPHDTKATEPMTHPHG